MGALPGVRVAPAGLLATLVRSRLSQRTWTNGAPKGVKHMNPRAVWVPKGWAQKTQIPAGKKEVATKIQQLKTPSVDSAMPQALIYRPLLTWSLGCFQIIWRQMAGHGAPALPLPVLGHESLSARLRLLPALEPGQCTSNCSDPVGRSDCEIQLLPERFLSF